MELNQQVAVTLKVIHNAKFKGALGVSFNFPGLTPADLPTTHVLPLGKLEAGTFRLAFVPPGIEDAQDVTNHNSSGANPVYVPLLGRRVTDAKLHLTVGHGVVATFTEHNGFKCLAFPPVDLRTVTARAPKQREVRPPADPLPSPLPGDEKVELLRARDLLNQCVLAGRLTLTLAPDGTLRVGVPTVRYL